jgi:hypothetical protein
MKKLYCILLCFVSISSYAQRYYREEPPILDKQPLPNNRWYIGTGIGLGLGFSSNSLSLGANPEVGYTLNEWLDVGASFNINYYSYSNIDGYNTKQRSFNYGGGLYARAYPFQGFFLQVLPEYNWIDTKIIPTAGNTQNYKQQAASLLVGAGFGRRFIGQSSFYTLIMVDVGSEVQSPYKDYYGGILPVFRTGFTFYLHSKKK